VVDIDDSAADNGRIGSDHALCFLLHLLIQMLPVFGIAPLGHDDLLPVWPAPHVLVNP
jgi:hypothetical protein